MKKKVAILKAMGLGFVWFETSLLVSIALELYKAGEISLRDSSLVNALYVSISGGVTFFVLGLLHIMLDMRKQRKADPGGK